MLDDQESLIHSLGNQGLQENEVLEELDYGKIEEWEPPNDLLKKQEVDNYLSN